MNKNSLFAAALCLLASLSCQKEANEVTPVVTPSVGPTSFVASLPETRTALDNHSVLWADNDEIRVFGYTEGEDIVSAVFQFTGTNDAGLAVFSIKEGEELGEFDTYYAAYPALSGITVKESNGVVSMAFPRLNSFPYSVRNQRPTAGQFDPNLTVLTAKFVSDRLVFRHGASYVKITIPEDGISEVDVHFGESACLADTPTYNLETGSISSTGNSSKNITAKAEFTNGVAYYLAAIPRGSNTINTTTVTYKYSNGENKTIKTNHFDGKVPIVGQIFDLGRPIAVSTPKITFTAPSKLEYDATSGSFAYSVLNPVEGKALTATLEEGVDWISNIAVGTNTVTFDCEQNDTDEERSAVITLSYEGAEDVEVTISQKGNVTPSTVTYTWDFQVWKLKSGTYSSDYYYYDSANKVYVESATASEPEQLYFTKSLAVAVGSNWYYANMSSGGANYSLVIPTTKSGILTLWATTNKKATESGSGNIEVHYGSGKQTAALSVDAGNYYDASAELCNAKPFEFTIDGTENLIQIYKSGSNGIRIYKVEFVVNN